MALVDAPTYTPTEARALTMEAAEALLKLAVGDPLLALLVLAVDTGARQGELFGLKRSDVDLNRRTVTFRRTISFANNGELIETLPKTGKPREVPISKRSAQAIEPRLKGAKDGIIFTSPSGDPLRKENFARRSWRPLIEKAGLDGLKFHALRHSCATRLLTQAVHPRIVADRLGHASTQVTLDVYSHEVPGMSAIAADLFDGIVSNEPESA